jgi:nicotinate dehydrogenase subunit B
MLDSTAVSRRSFLKSTGSLTIWFSVPNQLLSQNSFSSRRPSPSQLDSYIAIRSSGIIDVFFGKMDMGQGVNVSIAQIVADELDAPIESVNVIMGDTALTVNQGGGSGSTGIELGSKPIRQAAAEARRYLIDMGASRLGLQRAQVSTDQSHIYFIDNPAEKISYIDLIGDQYFDLKLNWNGIYGNNLNITGLAMTKNPAEYQVIGFSHVRPEVESIVFGQYQYIVDIKVPGMWHARVIRPDNLGASLIGYDESSINLIPDVEVVTTGEFIAVIAKKEWHAVKAASQLRVVWRTSDDQLPSHENIYDYIKSSSSIRITAGEPRAPDINPDLTDYDRAVSYASQTITAEYHYPFQSHASIGPACAVCDVRDGEVILYTATQKPHYAAEGVANLLGYDIANVRAIWVPGPGSFGRNDSGDCALDAAMISYLAKRPIRLQGMRADGIQWDRKSPASIHTGTAAFDANGDVIAYKFNSKGFSAGDIESNESNPSHSLVGMQTGLEINHTPRFLNPSDKYELPNQVRYWETIQPIVDRASPLRTSHLRDPLGPQIHFASESFIDEMAFASKTDPIEFRLKYLNEARDREVIQAVADRYAWQPGVASTNPVRDGNIRIGRGVAYTRRNNTVVAVICELRVNVQTGRIYPQKFIVASDQGIIINPLWLRRTIEGNVIHATSRALLEEVHFDDNAVISKDWLSYKTIDIDLAPYDIDIVLINHNDLPPYGAGEPSSRTIIPAVANAFFDATGLRLRSVPFLPEKVLVALGPAAG